MEKNLWFRCIGHAAVADSSVLTLPWWFTTSINNAVFIFHLSFLICVLLILFFFKHRKKSKAQDLDDYWPSALSNGRKEENISGEKKELITASDFARKYGSDSLLVMEKNEDH